MAVRIILGVFIVFLAAVSAAEIHGAVVIKRKLTKRKLTPSAGAYDRGVSVKLDTEPIGDPLAFERTHIVVFIEDAQAPKADHAVQIRTRPYFYEQFETQGYGIRGDILQGHVTYARLAEKRSLVIRAGQLSSAFGSFLLRYDDAVNPLIDIPISYGYYGRGVTNYGLLGAQVDATLGRLDARVQLTDSSPVNRRGIGDSDQCAVWTGGAGVTIRQGLRAGVSGFRGPYVHREYQYFLPGEAKPVDLPGTGYGLDVQWGHGPWNVNGELQRFQLIYRAIPTFNHHAAYAEVRRVLHPRWYLATRAAYSRASVIPPYEICETAVASAPTAAS